MFEIIVNCICKKCNKMIDDAEDAEIICNDCDDNDINEEVIINSIKHASEQDYIWKDRELYVGFENEEEKTNYLEGIKKGYFDALFQISDFFAIGKFFSNEIEDKFYPEKD